MGLRKTDPDTKQHRIHFIEEGQYYATREGKIYYRTGRELSAKYNEIRVSRNGIRHAYTIPNIIATMFVDNPFNKTVPYHIDGNKDNNRADNLEWITRRELCLRSAKRTNKLTLRQVRNIRKAYATGETTHSKLAKKYKVTQSYICQIINNRVWKEHDKNKIVRDPLINERVVLAIREEYAAGEVSQTHLADKWDLTPGRVSDIINRKIWNHI